VEKRRRSGFRQKFFFHPCGKESLNRIRRGVGCESQSLTKGDVEADFRVSETGKIDCKRRIVPKAMNALR
jgi:hypothetical protein